MDPSGKEQVIEKSWMEFISIQGKGVGFGLVMGVPGIKSISFSAHFIDRHLIFVNSRNETRMVGLVLKQYSCTYMFQHTSSLNSRLNRL